ncbi:hypothetical protein Clacol_004965 [Clathrus columnatus]|uniref:Uncharacterized protein n=1 Tax=Clathrus columnatus TaxID=1419009 RepID=A0AAV5ADK6_9AGAM|nr:hypothetical protein Clacol_004965 [Clathrus columnatus]
MATELVIRQVMPFLRFGFIPFGGRSTAIKLRDGVWVLASTKLDEETKQTIDSLGDVKYIVTADGEHHFHLVEAEFKEAYPQAKVIGVPPVVHKPGVPKLDGVCREGLFALKVYGTDPPDTKYGYEDEFNQNQLVQFRSRHGFKNKDVAFFHKSSKSLILGDLLLNLPAKEQYSKASKPLLMSCYDFINPYNSFYRKVINSINPGKEDTQRDAKTVMSWDFKRIIPCHGVSSENTKREYSNHAYFQDVIEDDAKAAWGSAYADFLN